jgi:hypothetical protein
VKRYLSKEAPPAFSGLSPSQILTHVTVSSPTKELGNLELHGKFPDVKLNNEI